MAESAGGVALEATLDYSSALTALRQFQAEVAKVENSGKSISQLQASMIKATGQLQEVAAGLQTTAAGLDAAAKKTQELGAAATKAASEETAADAERAAGKAKVTDAMREEAAAYISAANAQAAAQKLAAQQQAQAAKDAAAAAKASAAARRADMQTADAIEAQMLADRIAQSKAADEAILASRAEAEAQQQTAARRAMADNQQVYLLEKQMAADAAAAQIASDKAILAEREERYAQEAAAAKAAAATQAGIDAAETARAVDARASASYEVAGLETKLRMLQRIELAERSTNSTVATNPKLAAQFPSSAVRDYTMVGSAYTTAHELGAELKSIGAGGTTAAAGIKATANEARELITILKDLFTGEWSRMGGSLTRLATLSGTFDGVLGALGGTILGVTVAIGALTVAAVKGAQEQTALNLALAQTGNYAGTTESGLDEIAEKATKAGGTIGTMRDVVLQLAQAGKYTSDQIETIATSASAIQAAGGNVEQFIQQVTSIKDAPTEAIYKLNEQYHFLTADTYEAIAAAERHGQAVQAAQMAVDAFANTEADRAKDAVENAGLIERAWLAVKGAISQATDAMTSIGKVSTAAQKVADLKQAISQAQYGGRDTTALDAQLAIAQNQLKNEQAFAIEQGKYTQQQMSLVQAQKALDAEREKLATPAQKRQMEADKLRASLAPLVAHGDITEGAVDQLIAQANAKYKDKKVRSVRGRIDPTPANAAQNAQQLASAELKTAQDRLAIEKALGQAIDEQQYAQIASLQAAQENAAYEAQRQKILKEIANTAANRNNNPAARASLQQQLVTLQQQHAEKLAELDLDYQSQELQRSIANALLNISTIEKSRQTILQSIQTLYGSDAKYQQDRLDDLTEEATIRKAQYDQAQQMEQLKQSNASAEEISLARQANTLQLATQIYAIEQDRNKLMFDNATTLQSIYQQTTNALQTQIATLEKGRTTILDSAVSGFSSGSVSANDALFQSFKSPQAAKQFGLQTYTGTIGSSMYDAITKQLSQSLTETTLKQFQQILQAAGATNPADAARQKAQDDLALNTSNMAQALQVTIPEKLQQLIDLANGTTAPTGPVGNAALNGGSGLASVGPNTYGFNSGIGSPQGAPTSAPSALFGPTGITGSTNMSAGIAGAADALNNLGKTGSQAFQMLGLNATQFSSLLYTGVVAATQGGMTAFKNFAVYAVEQLLQIYAMQKIVGLVGTLSGAGSSAGSAASSFAGAFTLPGKADGYVDERGIVNGPGGARDDTAGIFRLSAGEAVLNAAAVSYYGVDTIKAMNQRAAGSSRYGRPGGMADGGVVSGARPSVGTGGAGSTNITISVDAGSTASGQKPTGMQQAAQQGVLQSQLEQAVLGVITKYSAPGGPVYKVIKQTTSL